MSLLFENLHHVSLSWTQPLHIPRGDFQHDANAHRSIFVDGLFLFCEPWVKILSTFESMKEEN
eukprot:scaffold18204_cov55-Attheya_sp.AAC.1